MATHQITTANRSQMLSEPRSEAGLYSPNLLARSPWIGLLMVLIGGIIFVTMSINLQLKGPLIQWDAPLARSLPTYSLQHANYMHPITEAGFFIGGWVTTIGAFALLMHFSTWHRWEEFFMVLIGMVGESLIFLAINTSVGRPRPPMQLWHVLTISSFPSGHAEVSVVFFGLLAYFLVPKARSSFLKVLIVVLAVLTMLFIGFCRLMAGGHYLSDVIAGYALGLFWSGIAYTFIELFFAERRRRHGEKGEASQT